MTYRTDSAPGPYVGQASLEQGGEWGLGWVALFTLVWLVVG